MKTNLIKVLDFAKIIAKRFIGSFKEIFTTILEICAVIAIAVGTSMNWGQGWGLIVGGVLTIIISTLSSLESNPNRGN